MRHFHALYEEWTHGTKSLVVLYAIIAVFSLIGLARGKARAYSYVIWPVTTAVTTVIVALASTVIYWIYQALVPVRPAGRRTGRCRIGTLKFTLFRVHVRECVAYLRFLFR